MGSLLARFASARSPLSVISVTRLLKASKQQKPTRDSFIASPPGSPGGKTEPTSKLNVAQSDLQACETQLANKERELDAMRLSAIRVGLHARCKAMVECGWAWGEMGKEGLRALEDLDAPNGHCAYILPLNLDSYSILVLSDVSFELFSIVQIPSRPVFSTIRLVIYPTLSICFSDRAGQSSQDQWYCFLARRAQSSQDQWCFFLVEPLEPALFSTNPTSTFHIRTRVTVPARF